MQNSVSSPGVNFINLLSVDFLYKIFGAKISNPKASFVVLGAKILYKKHARKTLMKLTLGKVGRSIVGEIEVDQ